MPLIEALFPAPWWTPLSYKYERALPGGLRLSAPLGRGSRIGLTADPGRASDFDEALAKPITALIDETPPVPEDLRRLIKWFGETFFIGEGFAMKNILPSKFFTEEKLAEAPLFRKGTFSAESLYDTEFKNRRAFYMELLEKADGSSLLLFPEIKAAESFWKSLPPACQAEGQFWPQGPAKQWKLWKAMREGKLRFVVGSPGAAFLPAPKLSLIVMDEENQGSWRTQNHPGFHMRTLMGMRAIYAGASFVTGGSMPSSKGFLRAEPECLERSNDKKVIFVSLKDSSASEFAGIKDTLPLSDALQRETAAVRRAGGWALWLLDRKGYAVELACEECGGTVKCARCGSAMRWEEKERRLCCLECGEKMPLPEKCPNCGGLLLAGQRPGIEALYVRAEGALKGIYKTILLPQSSGDKLPEASELLEKYPGGGLLIGTKKLLTLCDGLSPALIGWIDADAEARGQGYDAGARAYATLWESLWRGTAEEKSRRIVVQSRRPGKGWQEGLTRGWGSFWKRELKEREEWELPPFVPMIKITMPRASAAAFEKKLSDTELEFWSSEENSCEFWVRTKRFGELRALLAPFFDIKSARKGFPAVLLYLE